MSRRAVIALCMVVGIGAAACSSDSGSKVSAAASTTSVAGGGATTTTAIATDLAGASTSPTSTPSQGQPQAMLTDVRVAPQAGFDRVVFQFDQALPGYSVMYEAQPFTNADTGKPIALAGMTRVGIKLVDASSFNQAGPTPAATYSGPTRMTPAGAKVIAEVAQVQDAEGTMIWGVGLNRETPFKVSTLTAPFRVVVDFVA